MLVRAEEQLGAAFALALGASRSSVVLVEELVPGREVTVNAFSVGGRFTPLTVTDRLVAEPPAFGVALAHVWPSSLAPEQVGAAVEAARDAARAVGVEEGPDLYAGGRRRATARTWSSWRRGSAADTMPSCAGRRSAST